MAVCCSVLGAVAGSAVELRQVAAVLVELEECSAVDVTDERLCFQENMLEVHVLCHLDEDGGPVWALHGFVDVEADSELAISVFA